MKPYGVRVDAVLNHTFAVFAVFAVAAVAIIRAMRRWQHS